MIAEVLACVFCGQYHASPYMGLVVCGRAPCLLKAMECPCPPAENPTKPPLCSTATVEA